MLPFQSNLEVVCHQIQSPDNLGAIARLMANFGVSQLRLSEPMTSAFDKAGKLAVGADFVLKKIRVYNGLHEALSGCVYAIGTTSRDDLKRRIPLSPEEGMRKLKVASARGKVALVLGGEKRGLSDDDLMVCNDVVAIPTHPQQPSMNLSQAAAVLLYLASTPLESPPQPTDTPPQAQLGTLYAFEQRWKRLLLESGFLNPQAPDYIMNELTQSLMRAQLTQREAELWLSAGQHLLRALSTRNERS